jgi:hypothetical protein
MAPDQVAILHVKGLIVHEIDYFTPDQVGGLKSHATKDGMDQGVHLMKNSKFFMSSKLCGELSHATKDAMP